MKPCLQRNLLIINQYNEKMKAEGSFSFLSCIGLGEGVKHVISWL